MTSYYVNQYELYQAERVKSDAEQRQADAERGMRAAARARLWQSLTRLVRGSSPTAGTAERACRARHPGLATPGNPR